MSQSQSASGLLKVAFLGHLVLSSWGMESPYLVPTGYLYYNLIFMISILWAISAVNVDSASMALMINVCCIVMDAFALSFWPRGGPSRERVYYGIAIANSVLRAVTAMLLFRLFRDRDTEGIGLNGVFADITQVFSAASTSSPGNHTKGYQNIENQDADSSSSQPSQQNVIAGSSKNEKASKSRDQISV